MIRQTSSPETLAEELLGRTFAELDREDQAVLRRIAAGTLIGLDADEEAALHVTHAGRLADQVAAVGGSWSFIVGFGVVLIAWVFVNSPAAAKLGVMPFDQYPYIFLNLMLSMLAAIQAPVIMMSQNRQAAKDRITARHDYEVNLRTQIEIIRLHRKFDQVVQIAIERERRRGGAPANGEG